MTANEPRHKRTLRRGGIVAALLASPLADADLELKREFEDGREIDLWRGLGSTREANEAINQSVDIDPFQSVRAVTG